jgi:dephospho-CoA kinase
VTYVVGLTGGIGSGKTLVSDRFAELGVPVIDTDVVAREIVQPGQPTLIDLVNEFGDQILLENGQLDRDSLRHLAFADDQRKQRLDDITHPAIREATSKHVSAVNYPYCIVVIPLLTADSAFSAHLNRVLTVSCDQEIRVARVMQRNNMSRAEVERIMQTQLSDAERLDFADDVIDNSASKESALHSTDELHLEYLHLSQASTQERA